MQRATPVFTRCRALSCALLLSLLAACGGGSTAPPLTVAGASAPPPAPAATILISGTAATGAPIVSGAVTARCQGGVAANTTTAATGFFSMSVVFSAMPCAVRVAPSGGGQVLYSVASGSGTSTTANVTPLTSLAVSLAVNAATAQTLDQWFATTASLPAIANALAGTQTTLRTALAAAGYTVPTPFSPITATFTASAGNAYDDLLEAVAAGLRATGTSFASAQTSFTSSAGTTVPAPAPAAPVTPVTPSGGLGATVSATLNPALAGSRNLQFNNDGAGCGTACSFTNGQLITVVLGTGNTLSIAGKTLSNPYNRILQGTTVPHTPELIWRDGNLEYALSNNAAGGSFNEINVGDISAPTSAGLPKFIGQIRAVATTGIANITQFAGTYAKATQYYGPISGTKRPLWTSVTIASNGAISFTGGDASAGGDLGPSVSASQMSTINDFTGCCGRVQILLNVDVNGDGAVNTFDQIRLFKNAAGQLASIEYDVSSTNYVGVLVGTPTPLPSQVNATIPTTNQIAGTALGTANTMDISGGGSFSFPNQGGFNLAAASGGNQWRILANHQAPMAAGAVFNCQVPDTSSNRNVSITLTVGSNIYYSTEGGRCQITLTSVTFANGIVSSIEGRFVAELFRPERHLGTVIINDGVFRWVRP